MRTEIYWIETPTPGRFAIMPRPRGGDWLEDEVASWRAAGLQIVVSLLTPGEVSDLDLREEESLCEAKGIQFLTFPIDDRGVPSSKDATLQLLTDLATRLAGGKNTLSTVAKGSAARP